MTSRRLALLACNALLLVALLTAFREGGFSDDSASPSVPIEKAREIAIEEGSQATVSARPLFRVLKSVPMQTAPVVAAPPATPSFRLAGVVWGDDEKLAVVQQGGEGGHRRLHLNEALDGWTLVELTPRNASFKSFDRRVTLALVAAAAKQE